MLLLYLFAIIICLLFPFARSTPTIVSKKASTDQQENAVADPNVNHMVRPLPGRIIQNSKGKKESLEDERDAQTKRMRLALNASLSRLLVDLPANDGQWCERMINGQLEVKERQRLEQWTISNLTKFMITSSPQEDEMCSKLKCDVLRETKCSQLRQLFPFVEQPLSEEERQFPLAYGLLVHKSPLQVLALLSAIYQPQNAYCLVFDEKSDEHFKKEMFMLADCFPNIYVMSVGQIHWCGFGIVRAVFGCLRYLAEINHDWRYFQYLSGVDLPLKTNLEMVRIFKRLNGTLNVDVLPFEGYRIRLTEKSMKPPLPLWKSSLSALIPRKTADVMVKSSKVRELLRYLQYTWCSDESLWATIAGNPQELKIPGGFNAAQFHAFALKEANITCNQSSAADENLALDIGEAEERHIIHDGVPLLPPAVGDARMPSASEPLDPMAVDPVAEPFQLNSFYISRYQVWDGHKHWHPLTRTFDLELKTKCNGKVASGSCVFGVGDLPSLVSRPELMVHKMYLDYQPAAYFCLWKSVWERALEWREQQKFQGRVYSELAAVKLARGEPVDKVRFFYDQTCHMSTS